MKLIPRKKYMRIAIEEARKAFLRGDYPIGACIVKNGVIVARGGNRVKTKQDSTKHIELELIQYVVGMHDSPYIPSCVLYTTHEPCPMCASAAVWARLGGIVFGNFIRDFKPYFNPDNPNNPYQWRTINISAKRVIKGHNIQLIEGFMREECLRLFKLTQAYTPKNDLWKKQKSLKKR